ncbi:hypothetical protein [Nocardioides sp. T2.26MG-1]|uniref:hypothetical protein n=1 Tax=Nocardioides sp. T2.26MG-1 TaxID=3041166 RepID=UPI0024775B36|nr:hypothetical protein [Nocardioides sp. T2.26MG-1]CAI9418379.1 hypothetical protein HIDPHFAB_03257 [Nocardioides sp. T2.26MG-1]
MRLAVGTALAALALAVGGPNVAFAADPPTPASGGLALHESTAPSPTPADPHSGHDMSDMGMSDMTEEEMAEMDEPAGHGGHGTSEHAEDPGDTVSSGTRAVVLGGFAAVNVGVLGGALVLRRHDRRHPRHGTRAGRIAR